MRSLVVYESWFGNTQHVAEKIALALQEKGQGELASLDDRPSLEGVDQARPGRCSGASSSALRNGEERLRTR